jgi:hypothetical protein
MVFCCWHCSIRRLATPKPKKNGLSSVRRQDSWWLGPFIPVGILIGLDAMERLKVGPRALSIVYYNGVKPLCPCIADGVMIATQASPGRSPAMTKESQHLTEAVGSGSPWNLQTILCRSKTITASVRGADGGRDVHRIAPRFAMRCGSSYLGMISAQTLRVCRVENRFPLFGIMPAKLRTAAARPSPVGHNAVAARR